MDFLTHFKLPICYETSTELLTSLHQSNSIHISDHIHEWRCRRQLIKATISDQLLVDWFTKSLFPHIARDVAMGGIFTKEQAISQSHYLDLVYSQLGMLYDLIPNIPLSSNDPTKPAPRPHVDGMIDLVSIDTTGQMIGQHRKSNKATNPSLFFHTSAPSKPPSQTSKVNSVQSTAPKNPQQFGGKMKGNNNKKNKKTSEQSGPKTQENIVEGKPKRKAKHLYMICKEDHFTKYFPCLAKIHQYLE
jgi:hypothetical protein